MLAFSIVAGFRDPQGRAGAEAGEGKHNRCAHGAYERSELAQSCLAVLAGTGAPATPRRLRTRAADREQKTGEGWDEGRATHRRASRG